MRNTCIIFFLFSYQYTCKSIHTLSKVWIRVFQRFDQNSGWSNNIMKSIASHIGTRFCSSREENVLLTSGTRWLKHWIRHELSALVSYERMYQTNHCICIGKVLLEVHCGKIIRCMRNGLRVDKQKLWNTALLTVYLQPAKKQFPRCLGAT